MLGILRARGATGHEPADRTTLRKLAGRLATYGPAKGDWARIVSYSGDTSFADKAAALARYDRAVGLDGLVNGLEAAKRSIASRLLSDSSVSIYAGGRNDIVRNRVDVRVLTVIAYLRESFGQVSVSSLITGHRLYARPGVISAHISGHAVDISGLGRHPDPGPSGARRDDRARRARPVAAPGGSHAAADHLAARHGRTVVPDGRPLQPHPSRVLVAEVVLRREDGSIVCERCVLADTALMRMKGLLGRRDLPRGEGILLKPASSVHMAFMRFPIDAVFLDRDLRVVKIAADLSRGALQAVAARRPCSRFRPARPSGAGSPSEIA